MFKPRGNKYWFCLVTVFCAAAAVLVSCGDGHHHHGHTVPPTGVAKGYAYFPFEDEWGNYPVYYDTGNELILVTLYDADEI